VVQVYSESYNFPFHENFVISTFIRQKLSFCIICIEKCFYFIFIFLFCGVSNLGSI
jgi:hypothetical protein